MQILRKIPEIKFDYPYTNEEDLQANWEIQMDQLDLTEEIRHENVEQAFENLSRRGIQYFTKFLQIPRKQKQQVRKKGNENDFR